MSYSSVKNDEANTVCKAKPFLKWVGGKVQLLPQFQQYYPRELREGKIETYSEPFLEEERYSWTSLKITRSDRPICATLMPNSFSLIA